MKVLITGGAGFIGSNVVDAYIDAGHEVVVVDDLSSGKQENLNPGAKFYLADIRSEEIKKIFHLRCGRKYQGTFESFRGGCKK
jgi:UDP-glucose 4-epimerase